MRIRMPVGLTPDQRARLERAAHECPVSRSLLPEIGKDVEFEYAD